MDKVSQTYWDNSYSSYQYDIPNDQLTQWLNERLNKLNGSVFEAGCYPGRYLAWLGKQGWTVNGMDLTPRMETDFKEWLSQSNIRFGKIEKGDVLEYLRKSDDRYDMVCSFGFVEHFENFLEIISLHGNVLKKGGTLIITTPHFRGFVQNFLHKWLDRENFKRHHIPSMNPALWKERLEAEGYTVSWSGYFGNFDFWADRQKRNLFNKISLKILEKIIPLLKWLPNSKLYSPYCGLIATRR